MRIGPKMQEFIDFVRARPGTNRFTWAQWNLYHGKVSRQYSYAAANRAIKAGLVHTEKDSNGILRCFVK